MSISTAATSAARLIFVLSFVVLTACVSQDPPDTESLAPVQSPNDQLAYRLVTLDNGLQTLLVSNPSTAKAAASLDVLVGSGDNPADRDGLAHFLEHMLFLGTEKYPDPAEYERFITEHGGSRNAYTALEHTNYFFDVDAEHFEGALDRFAQFFVAPTLDGAYVENERKVVHAEYQMGLRNDGRRGFDVLQASMNPAHPYSRFTVGSLETLADLPGKPVREDLLEFYTEHYSANRMRLVVLGRESLDELEGMVDAMFSGVANRNSVLPPIDAPLFVDAQLPMLLKVKPQGTLRQLEINFQIPDFRDEYRAKPTAYLSNLVGHEGEGSLLSALKREGLADGLSSGAGLSWRGGALFSVNVALTEAGAERYEDVLQYVFAYLDMLRDGDPVERIYREHSALAALSFRFAEPVRPISYVSSLSSRMHDYDDVDILQGPYMMERFDRELITETLGLLTPERAQVVLTAPDVTTDRQSPYYDVAYSRIGPEAIMLSSWTGLEADSLRLPPPNPFIAEDVELLALRDDNPDLPALRVDTERKRVWHRQATDFRVPKGMLYLSFRSPLVGATPEQRAASSLYAQIVSDAINEYTYPALLAGVGVRFYRHSQGIGLRISGYNDKQLRLLQDLLDEIATQEFDPARFERIRREMVLQLQNTAARRPMSQLIDELGQALQARTYPDEALVAALDGMKIADLTAYRDRFWASARLEAMLYGNHPVEDAQRVADLADAVLGEGPGEPALAPQVLAVGAGEALQLEADIPHNDVVVAWYLQGAGQTVADRAAVALTAQAIESGFFQELRTEQQLGYIVQSYAWPLFDMPALMLRIQSPSHSAADVYASMERFLDGTLDDLTEEQFVRHRDALVNAILKPHENLGERAEFYWQAIARREWDFDQRERLASTVQDLSYEDWQAYFREVFVDERRSLLSFSAGALEETPKDAGDEVFDDPAALRQSRPLVEIDLAPL